MDKKEKKEELSPIEALLDENNAENIVLYNEKNEPVEFEQIAIVPIDEVLYAILKPIEKMDGVEDDEAIVFGLKEIDEEYCLVIEDNDEIIDNVFDKYYEMTEDFENNTDTDKKDD